MDEARFQDLLDRRGEDLALWPAADRLGAEALIARSSRARTMLTEAQALRAAFSAMPAPARRPDLAARILALADATDETLPPRGRRPLAAASRFAMLFTGVMVAGLVAGAAIGPSVGGTGERGGSEFFRSLVQ